MLIALSLLLATQAAADPQVVSGRGGVAEPARLVRAGEVMLEVGAGVAHLREGDLTTLNLELPELRLRAGVLEDVLEARVDVGASISYAEASRRALPTVSRLTPLRAGAALKLFEGEGLLWAAHAGALIPVQAGDPLGLTGALAGRIALGASQLRVSLGALWSADDDNTVELPLVFGVETPLSADISAVGELLVDAEVFPTRRAELALLVGGRAKILPAVSGFAHAGVNIAFGPPSYFALVGVSLMFAPPGTR